MKLGEFGRFGMFESQPLYSRIERELVLVVVETQRKFILSDSHVLDVATMSHGTTAASVIDQDVPHRFSCSREEV